MKVKTRKRKELFAEHLEELKHGSGLTDETIERAGLYSSDDVEEIKRLLNNHRVPSPNRGLCFPYGYNNGFVRIKLLHRIQRTKGKEPPKYESPVGSLQFPYFGLDGTRERLLKGSTIERFFWEGEKKKLLAEQTCKELGIPGEHIGLPGDYGWVLPKKRGGSKVYELNEELAQYLWESVITYLGFDNDKAKNKNVRDAEKRFATVLYHLGCQVKIIDIPWDGEKLGIDDYIVKHGKEAMSDLIDSAKDFQPDDVDIEHKKQLTDRANAIKLVEKFGQQMIYISQWKKWYVFDGRLWIPDSLCQVQEFAKQTADVLFDEINPRSKRLNELVANAKRGSSVGGIRAMAILAQSDCAQEYTLFDRDRYLINFQNCTFNLQTCQRQGFNKEDYITQIAPIPYIPGATCPKFEQFMQDTFINEGLVAYVQRLLGCMLVGNAGEQLFIVWYGTGQNGKSALNDVIKEVLGPDYVVCAPENSFMVRKHEEHSTELACLYRKRIILANETSQQGALNEQRIKFLTGESEIEVRRMREDFWRMRITGMPILSSNFKPRIVDQTHGMWRRIRLIPFNQVVPDEKKIPYYGEKLAAEEGPGIVNWLLQGWFNYKESKLQEPKIVADATKAYRHEMDVVQSFIEECCIVKKGEHIRSSTFYEQFNHWNKGNLPISRNIISEKLISLGFEKFEPKTGPDKNCYCFNGITVTKTRW